MGGAPHPETGGVKGEYPLPAGIAVAATLSWSLCPVSGLSPLPGDPW